MLLLLASLVFGAPPAAPAVTRLFVELDVGLPGKSASAVAISPDNDKVLLVAVDGTLFRTGNAGDTWDVVLKPRDKGGLSNDEQMNIEDAAEEAMEAGGEEGSNAGLTDGQDPDGDGMATDNVDSTGMDTGDAPSDTLDPDLDPSEVDSAIDDIEQDIQQSLEADKQGTDSSLLPEGDQDVGTDRAVPTPRENPGVRRVVFVNADTVVVATHRGLFRSTDSGRTFEPVPLPRGGKVRNIRDVAVAPNIPTFIVAATEGGTLLSRDGGVSWMPASGPAGSLPGLSCAMGPGPRPTVVVGTPAGLARSLDGGRTFEPVALPGERANRAVISVTIDPGEDRLFAVTPTMLFTGAPSTRALTPTGAGWRAGLMAVHAPPTRPGTLWGGGRSGLFLSTDGGRSGAEIGATSMVRDITDIAVGARDPDLVAVATSYGAFLYQKLEAVERGINPREALALLMAQEPLVAEVAEWAVEHHRMTLGVTRGMERRVRISALAPAVQVRAQATPYIPRPPWETQLTGMSYAMPYGVFALAVWPTEDLVLRAEERFVNREKVRMLKERDRIFRRIIKTYEQRRREQVSLLTQGSRNATSLARKRLKLQQLTAVLDAKTGGRFTLEARRRGAPGDGISVQVGAMNGKGRNAADGKAPATGAGH